MVTDTDRTSYSRSYWTRAQVRAFPNTFAAVNGDDITFTVEASSHSARSAPVTGIESNIADCNRTFDTEIVGPNIERYTCVARNVQLPFQASFTPLVNVLSANQDPDYPTEIIVSSVLIEAAGTPSIDISHQDEGPDSVVNINNQEIKVHNNGTDTLHNLQITSDTDLLCNSEVVTLFPNQTYSYTCDAPDLTDIGFLSTAVTVTAETTDGVMVSDTDSTTMYKYRYLNVDISIDESEPNGLIGTGQLSIVPGSSDDVTVTIKNTGEDAIDSIVLRAEILSRYFVRTYADLRDCVDVVNQDVSFYLEPDQSTSYSCTISYPSEFPVEREQWEFKAELSSQVSGLTVTSSRYVIRLVNTSF